VLGGADYFVEHSGVVNAHKHRVGTCHGKPTRCGAAPAFHPLARIPRFAIQGTRFQRFF
jgi:hypothetical protein